MGRLIASQGLRSKLPYHSARIYFAIFFKRTETSGPRASNHATDTADKLIQLGSRGLPSRHKHRSEQVLSGLPRDHPPRLQLKTGFNRDEVLGVLEGRVLVLVAVL